MPSAWSVPLEPDPTPWLLEAGEPWVRYRTLTDFVGLAQDDAEVVRARNAITKDPRVRRLIEEATAWPGYPLERHNNARHPIHALTILADFGLQVGDPGMGRVVRELFAHRGAEGAFETLLRVPEAFGGSGRATWAWMLCDAPLILYCLAAFGLADHPHVLKAADHLASLVQENGWPCAASAEMGRFHGPGRRGDPCPMANLLALKALSWFPEHRESPAVKAGAEMLLSHWDHTSERRFFLFGAGSGFRKLKYPFVWFDLLHVADVITRLPATRQDARAGSLVQAILGRRDALSRFTPESVWLAYREWEFGSKRQPSPWLTFLALRVLRRLQD